MISDIDKDLALAIYSLKDCVELLFDIVEDQQESIETMSEAQGLWSGIGQKEKLEQVFENIKALRSTIGRIQNETNPAG